MPAESQPAGAGNDSGYRTTTIMAGTAILDGAAKQVKVPTLVAGGAKLEGQTHNLAAEPVAAMAKEFFLGR